jgi:hypothetical protein
MASEELQEETEFDDSRDRVRRLSEQEIIKRYCQLAALMM